MSEESKRRLFGKQKSEGENVRKRDTIKNTRKIQKKKGRKDKAEKGSEKRRKIYLVKEKV